MLGSVLKTKRALCIPTDCKELTSVKSVQLSFSGSIVQGHLLYHHRYPHNCRYFGDILKHEYDDCKFISIITVVVYS